MQKAENFSIICGTGACNASCPFCVSKMTGLSELGLKEQPINWRNFDKAAQMAKNYEADSVIITGKGEPTLYPDQITQYLEHLRPHNFPLIDLQTNAVLFDRQRGKFLDYLRTWYDLGLAWVAISIVHFLSEENRKVYTPRAKEYVDLPKIVADINEIGLSARFSVTMFNGGLDNPEKVDQMINWSKQLDVRQLTLRRVAKPALSENEDIGRWTEAHLLTDNQMGTIREYLAQSGSLIDKGGHGSLTYDVRGQNVCLTNALTIDPESPRKRQIIFYPNGRVRFDWQHAGATLL